MGAAQNQRIHAGFHQRCQILPGHRLDDYIPLPKPAVLHQRDKQRAGLADHMHIGVQTLQSSFVSSGASGGQCGDHADLFIFCGGQCLPAGGLHHAQHRQIIFLPQGIQRGGGHCAAGDQNRLQVKGPEKGDVLTGIFQKGLPGTSAVWHPGSISKIDEILSRQQTPQGLHRCQSAQPGIKYPDRTVIHTARLLFSRVFVQKVYYTIASSAVQGQKRRFSQLKFAGRRFFRFWRQIFGFLPAFSGSIFRWVLL